uniref:Uncharacterized protein n=1 Tax=Rhizophora mucronata TaxID=61149 RepID=A0A2P2Q1Y9_RHIMU
MLGFVMHNSRAGDFPFYIVAQKFQTLWYWFPKTGQKRNK